MVNVVSLQMLVPLNALSQNSIVWVSIVDTNSQTYLLVPTMFPKPPKADLVSEQRDFWGGADLGADGGFNAHLFRVAPHTRWIVFYYRDFFLLMLSFGEAIS